MLRHDLHAGSLLGLMPVQGGTTYARPQQASSRPDGGWWELETQSRAQMRSSRMVGLGLGPVGLCPRSPVADVLAGRSRPTGRRMLREPWAVERTGSPPGAGHPAPRRLTWAVVEHERPPRRGRGVRRDADLHPGALGQDRSVKLTGGKAAGMACGPPRLRRQRPGYPRSRPRVRAGLAQAH